MKEQIISSLTACVKELENCYKAFAEVPAISQFKDMGPKKTIMQLNEGDIAFEEGFELVEHADLEAARKIKPT